MQHTEQGESLKSTILKCYKNVKGLYNFLKLKAECSFVTFILSDETTRCQGPEQNNRYKHLRKSSNFTL